MISCRATTLLVSLTLADRMILGQALTPVIQLGQPTGSGTLTLNIEDFKVNQHDSWNNTCAWDICLNSGATFDNGDPIWGSGNVSRCAGNNSPGTCIGWWKVLTPGFNINIAEHCALKYNYAPDGGAGLNRTNISYASGTQRNGPTFFQIPNMQGACVPPSPPPGSRKGGGGSQATGVYIILVFAICLFVYVVGGIIFKTRAGAFGLEAIPHVDLWRNLPGLIKDGVRFTFSICFGGSGVNSYRGYEKY